MSQKTRILLKRNNQLKKFFFILPLKDGSICFGSSLPKLNELKIGNIQIPEGEKGIARVNFQDTKSIEPMISKFTYHPSRHRASGVIQLKTNKDSYLLKYDVSRLESIKDYRKIFIVIPKDPKTYPVLEEEKSENDIIIPIDNLGEKPFCVYVFLCRKQFDWKQLVVRDAVNIVIGICENKDYLLIIELYQKAQFKEWPKYTTFIPYVDGVNIDI